MKDPLVTPTPTSSSSNNNGRMILAISLTLSAFLIEIYNGNNRTLNLSNILPSTPFTLLFMITTLIVHLYLKISTLQQKAHASSIPGLPATPNANFLLGHYGQLIHSSDHHTLFRSSATPSGITSLWGPNFKTCASILKSEHVRLVLRHTPSRDFSSFIVRHGRKTLGRDSLILIEGGKEWRRTRNVVQKAFNRGAIEAGRGEVVECAVEMVRWLMGMVDDSSSSGGDGEEQKRKKQKLGSGCKGHKCIKDKHTGKEHNIICLDVENFFKLFSLDVFGKVTMDYDFECFKKATSITSNDDHNNNCDENKQQHCDETNNNDNNTCTCFTSPPEAAAFEYLERDIGIRAHPKHLINPFTQLYWLPTQHNREYYRNLRLVNGLMEGVIGFKLDEFLGRHGLMTEEKEKEQLNDNAHEEEEEENDMITMMLKSVIEEQYRHESKEQKQHQHHLTNKTTISSSSCPFSSASSSSTTSSCPFSSNNINNNIPTTAMTKSDRAQIIKKVSQILHTLLVAGYETTAVSLSYTMYCLSKHPRCQDRACEEARRVMPTWDTTNKFDEDALPYCKAIILESLRIHVPIIFTTRVSSKNLILDTDDDGGKVTIPKDTRFILNPTIIHNDERNFERAEEFLPERWVKWENGGWVDRDFEKEMRLANDNARSTTTTTTPAAADASPPPSLSEKYTAENAQADTISAANPQSFFAFSDGARNCIGRRLAIMESTIFIAVLLRDMSVDLAEEGYELVKERRFVILAPKDLAVDFWKRDD